MPASLDLANEKNHLFEASTTQVLIDLLPVARFLVSNGSEIVVERGPEASEPSLRWRILGPGFGALLLQRNACVLHATVVETPHGAVGLMGRSGAGKSTLAAALVARGHRLLLDDVCAVTLNEGMTWAETGNPYPKLWADAIDALGLDRGERLSTKLEKFELKAGAPPTRAFRLQAMIALEPGEAWSLTPLSMEERMTLCLAHTYRREYLPGMGRSASNFSRCAEIAARLQAYRLTRPRTFAAMDETVSLIERTLEEAA